MFFPLDVISLLHCHICKTINMSSIMNGYEPNVFEHFCFKREKVNIKTQQNVQIHKWFSLR